MIFDESKLLPLIGLTNAEVVKSTSYDPLHDVNPPGTLVVANTGFDVANQGLPDYWVYIEIQGETFVDSDPDKSIIRQMYSDALASVSRWTPAQVTSALGWDAPAKVVGIINIRSFLQLDSSARVFRITLTLATTDTLLEYYEHPLPVYQIDDTGMGVQYIRFVNSTPCAVQRITKVETVAPDGGARSVVTREVAYGDWNDRANLTYYPINQPVPVQSDNSNTTPSASDSEADSNS